MLCVISSVNHGVLPLIRLDIRIKSLGPAGYMKLYDGKAVSLWERVGSALDLILMNQFGMQCYTVLKAGP